MSKLEEIRYFCRADQSLLPAMQALAVGSEPRPLLLALHTWSCDYKNGAEKYHWHCQRRNWHLVYPDFRGPNTRPQACGSELMLSDIQDAVNYMLDNFSVDPERVYVVGGSGGGHATLLLAARLPQLFAAASAWCPISDIAAWHRQCKGGRHNTYAEHIEQVCGGNPQENPEATAEAARRSPLTYMSGAAALPLDINAGIHDGHSGSVPVSQSIEAYNLLAAQQDRISQSDIDYMLRQRQVPEQLRWTEGDPAFGDHKLLLRQQSNQVRLNIFEGGHESLNWAACEWLAKQKKNCSADWSSGSRPPQTEGTQQELSR
ncbi:MAG: prolyl oligopeptidase family serine peptidase [Lentisphaeria bacterium]|jgi:pimeloyl-ACP methyl ester carboxylesterase|nr:prolyl oligopeptidase family serine peptidase [Lentisphaeria bacterium]MDY0175478.1 prolyl oligopeptidase family serine peptidase [Lentisphaeria bacterium]